jgi:hypothetical protein
MLDFLLRNRDLSCWTITQERETNNVGLFLKNGRLKMLDYFLKKRDK